MPRTHKKYKPIPSDYPREGVERRYFPFVHYGLERHKDWRFRDGHLVIEDHVMPKLVDDLRYLGRILIPAKDSLGRKWKGFAFVFLDPGWTQLLRAKGSTLAAATLGMDLAKFAGKIEKELSDEISDWRQHFRIVTASDLIDLLQQLDNQSQNQSQNQRMSQKYAKLLTGGVDSLRYDGAKVVEAVVRIANIGRQVPILRFDKDVIFYGQHAEKIDHRKEALCAQENILKLCERYCHLSADPQINYFVFSGGYLAEEKTENIRLDRKDHTINTFDLINGFATRSVQLASLPNDCPGLEESVEILPRVVSYFLREISQYGANPFRQVISGAGLCLSDSAILVLPPFSNMRQNVVWIDDHLKYALHHELGHFGKAKRTRHTARLRNVWFRQLRHQRHPVYKDVQKHLQEYMLRLILGCVADSWLRKTPDLKESLRSLSDNEYRNIMREMPGTYAESFRRCVLGSRVSKAESRAIKQLLWDAALRRLRGLVGAWTHGEYDNTFMGLFARGRTHNRIDKFKSYLPNAMQAGLDDLVAQLPQLYPLERAVQLNRNSPADLSFPDALCTLVEDFVEYFEFVLRWKEFVQAVRFMLDEGGEEWMFPPDL